MSIDILAKYTKSTGDFKLSRLMRTGKIDVKY